jgi:hypothetical protein
MLLKPRQSIIQTAFLGFRDAGSIIKILKIACYCGGKASFAQGPILFISISTLNIDLCRRNNNIQCGDKKY